MKAGMLRIGRKVLNGRAWAYGIFWSWNIIFLAFMLLGFAPQVIPPLLHPSDSASIPAGILASALLLTLIPVASTVLGLTVLRRAPGRLLALGYGIEGPLMLLLTLRFFLLRQLAAGILLLMVFSGLGMAALLWQLLERGIDRRPAWLAYPRLAGLTLLLLAGLYAATWLAFYLVPLVTQVGQMARGLFGSLSPAQLNRTLLTDGLSMLLIALLGTILFFYSATLLIAMPVAVPVLYVRAWWADLRAAGLRVGKLPAGLVVAGTACLSAALWVLALQQPQGRAFALLRTPPASPAQARALLSEQGAIRSGLLNAYLANFRYLGAVGDVRHIDNLYRDMLHMAQASANVVQQLYAAVARPVLYLPVNQKGPSTQDQDRAMRKDAAEAAQLYERFFDQNILDAEREAILTAVRSTWDVNQAEDAAQVVEQRDVHLAQQDLTVTEQGDWADVELYEIYENQTGQRQEVVYYFSLPESAVITGLWLGNSPDRSQRFAYRVSPRGAAQAVYRNEVRYLRDPALVEQIGPRQYRLRVFPVEPKRWSQGAFVAGPQLHMWLTWRVLAADSGWPMPRLAEKRNIYWDQQSVRMVNGKRILGDAWLPASVMVKSPAEPVTHRIDLPGGQTVLAQPVSRTPLPQPNSPLRLAVVLDRSRSMARFEYEVRRSLTRLGQAAGSPAAVDVYLTASAYRGEPPSRTVLAALGEGDILYYGGQNPAELVAQFATLQAGEKYDAIVVLTDGSGYQLGASSVAIPVPTAPVWMVHLAGELPLGYDDALLQAIEGSGGGVTGDVEQVLSRLAAGRAATGKDGVSGSGAQDVVDGYLWSTLPTTAVGTLSDKQALIHQSGDPFAAFAARRLILAEATRQRASLSEAAVLDRLHALAQEQSIVTPYSSMVVLVNDQQKELLDRLEQAPDRFQREYENVGDTKGQTALVVTGVPEPEEWLLLALAAAMLAWYWRSVRRQQARPVPH